MAVCAPLEMPSILKRMPHSAVRGAACWVALSLAIITHPTVATAGASVTAATGSSSSAARRVQLRPNLPEAPSDNGTIIRTPQRWPGSLRSTPAKHRLSLRSQAASRQQHILQAGKLSREDTKENSPKLYHEIAAGGVFLACVLLLCCLIVPITVFHRIRWSKFASDEDSFMEYGQYRFFNWFSRSQTAPIIVVVSITLFVVVIGAILYALMVGGKPSQALFRVFVWASASSADTETSVGGRFLGVIGTVFGLIILALLLSMVTEAFTMKMQQVKMGLGNVCEGGHVVILGFSAAVKTLLEEMAIAYESEGGTIFVILAKEPKVDVEQQLERMGLRQHVRNSRVIVRSGNPSSYLSLKQVAADKALKILSLMDHTISPDEALAKQIRILLALKSQQWPLEGTIIVQVASAQDMQLVKSLYPDTKSTKVEVLVIGDIIAKLMVQSAWEHGLAGVFGMMLGFDGDEFYFKEFPELVGKTFLEVYFRIPNAVALGVYRKDGMCMLNPGWDYIIQRQDEIIVLAEDDDTFDVEATPYFDFEQEEHRALSPARYVGASGIKHRSIHVPEASSALIIGWNHNIGKLLSQIASTFPRGSEITIFSDVPQEARDKAFARWKEDGIIDPDKITIKHDVVETEDMTRRTKLEHLNHGNARAIFMLADAIVEGDDTNIAALAQLQYIGRSIESKYPFDPVVEMCENSTKDHLKVAELDNLIHSSSLISQALAAVTYDPKVNTVYTEFFSDSEIGFAIAQLQEFTPEGQLPKSISFAEAAFMVSGVSKTILVGWTRTNPETRETEWFLNPRDKTSQRPWLDTDRICGIVELDKRLATPR